MKTVLITGASSGIGEACCDYFAQNMNLVLVARSEEKLFQIKEQLENQYHHTVTVIPMDLCQENAAVILKEKLAQANISIDVLINNAGYGDLSPFLESNWDKQKNMIQLNITTLMQMTYVFGNEMKKQGHGHILNISSVASFFAGPNMSCYYASKAFVLSFSQAVNEELKGTGVTVSCICPGPTSTQFDKVAKMKNSNMFTFHKPQSADAVAKCIYQIYLHPKPVRYHGTLTHISNIACRLLPRKLLCQITKYINGSKEESYE